MDEVADPVATMMKMVANGSFIDGLAISAYIDRVSGGLSLRAK